MGMLSLACFIEASRVWNGWDGTGVMVLVTGGLLLILMVIFLVFPDRSISPIQWFSKKEMLHMGILSGAFALYIILMDELGYLLATWLFLVGVTKHISPSRIYTILIWTGVVALGTYIIFKKYLGMYLPVGLIDI
jgi:hypothetical protein